MRFWSHCSALAVVLLMSIALLQPAQSATRHRAAHRAQAASGKSVHAKAAGKHRSAKSSRVAARSASEDKPVSKSRRASARLKKSHNVDVEEQRVSRRGGRRRQTAHLREAVLRTRRHRLSLEESESRATIDEIPLTRTRLALLPPLKGSHESLVRQNVRAEAEGLERIEDDADLNRLVRAGALVRLPTSQGLGVNPSMEQNRRYCRPWTSRFLTELAAAHYTRFRRSLQINSAVRTVEYQRRLMRTNGNAAPAEGDIASPHLTGATIDIGKKGLSVSEIGWLRAYLLPLQQAGRIDVEEEFRQACFHITVYKSYDHPSYQNNSKPLLATGID